MVRLMILSWSFTRGFARLAFAVLLLQGAATTASAKEREILVDLDYARIVKIPEGAQTLVIGNPLVADVTMLKNNKLMVITGKSFGTTNLIVLDQAGGQVGELIITVVPFHDKLIVQRGPHRESYSCKPDCRSSIDLGDDREYMNQTIEAMKLHEGSSIPGRR